MPVVKGSIYELDGSLAGAIREGVIQESRSSKGLLKVGPIYIEVKSTSIATKEAKRNLDEHGDLFDISLSEACQAQHFGWRYHVIRCTFIREKNSNEIRHIPNLAAALNESPDRYKLYVGMKDA